MKRSIAVRNALLAAEVAEIEAGVSASVLRILTGSAPAECEDAQTGTLLTEHALPEPLETGIANGVLTFDTIPNDAVLANGTAGYWRIVDGNGVCTHQGSVGTSGADLNLNTLTFTVGGPDCQITGFTISQPAGT